MAHSMPEGIANLMIPIAVLCGDVFRGLETGIAVHGFYSYQRIAMKTMYSVGMKKMGPYYMAGQKMNNTIIEYINGIELSRYSIRMRTL
ncbi:MAG: hypothetical protein ACLRJV_22035 [Eubacteriales bacterium]